MLTTLALLAACGGSGSSDGGGEGATDYLPEDGRYSEYGWAGVPSAQPLMLLTEDETWDLRSGETWNEAQQLGPFTLSTEDGLWLDDTLLLPERPETGLVEGGVEVLSMGEREVYYGTFQGTVSVEIEEGDFAGENVFAVGHGPIVITHLGVIWELVYYE